MRLERLHLITLSLVTARAAALMPSSLRVLARPQPACSVLGANGVKCSRVGVAAAVGDRRRYTSTALACSPAGPSSPSSPPPSSPSPHGAVRVGCNDAGAIERLGGLLADVLCRGDALLLHGDLGAGKTTLSRGLVRSKMCDPHMAVTSPSYLLDNTYAYGVLPEGASDPEAAVIHHMDLYRLPGPLPGGEGYEDGVGEGGFDASMLGIPGIYSACLCLLEWPERLHQRDLPPSFLDVEINISIDEARVVTLTPVGGWGEDSGQRAALHALAERLQAGTQAGAADAGTDIH